LHPGNRVQVLERVLRPALGENFGRAKVVEALNINLWSRRKGAADRKIRVVPAERKTELVRQIASQHRGIPERKRSRGGSGGSTKSSEIRTDERVTRVDCLQWVLAVLHA